MAEPSDRVEAEKGSVAVSSYRWLEAYVCVYVYCVCTVRAYVLERGRWPPGTKAKERQEIGLAFTKAP
jgi:hypothetical protein